MHAPRISVITINYNDHAGLRKTIGSVVAQTFRDFEFIIIDGGSTDGSVDVINDHLADITYWVSEKDNGIYHAMNKGIVKAKGEYLLFLNSGDYLHHADVLAKLSPLLQEGTDLIYGNSLMKSDTKEYLRIPSEQMTFSHFLNRKGPHHQSSLIRRTLFSEIGLYDERYRILADWDFFMKIIFLHQKPIRYYGDTIAVFGLEGVSSDQQNNDKLHREKDEIVRRNFPRFADDYNLLERYRNIMEKSRVVRTYMKYFNKRKSG